MNDKTAGSNSAETGGGSLEPERDALHPRVEPLEPDIASPGNHPKAGDRPVPWVIALARVARLTVGALSQRRESERAWTTMGRTLEAETTAFVAASQNWHALQREARALVAEFGVTDEDVAAVVGAVSELRTRAGGVMHTPEDLAGGGPYLDLLYAAALRHANRAVAAQRSAPRGENHRARRDAGDRPADDR